MNIFRLGLFGFSCALLIGHLTRYFPGMRQGMGIVFGLIAIAIVLGAAAGVMAIFMGKRSLSWIDIVMGALPGVLAGVAIIGIIVLGGFI